MKYFALIMSVVYAVAGCLILFTNFLYPQVSRFRVPLGIILLIYGAVRGFMWQRKQAQSREEQ
ncbi:MAG: hypothetical protein IPO60_11355 [Flavobacteriales bacterium]|nr:hypothetical protein [Flavobacteriales bacterium]MBK7288707.1 hypothetical protein [Flavobacteriales bacterium]MBK9060236.1 hypothetical protein [Flavobacteriales bacterium]MBK9598889.1 hypothetical protein [Flavobacteriales bacterium]HQY79957.1 hypothetical protein [Flavobacteriales bacterium]